jgi:hypothetical protein
VRASVVCLAAALVVSSAVADPVDGPAEITWIPDVPVEGQLFTIRVTPTDARAPQEVTGEVAGEALHFEPAPEPTDAEGATSETGEPHGAHPATRPFESLAPVPLDTRDSLSVTLTLHYAGGAVEARTVSVPVTAGAYRHEELTVAPRLGSPLSEEDRARLARDQARARAVSEQAHRTPRLWGAPFVVPRDDRVTSGFGNGRMFNGQVSSRHTGLDLDGEPGDTVVAATRGVVALVADFLLAGSIVYLDHGGGLVSGYFHLSDQLVTEGDTVHAGAPIGRVGATGRVTGPHLHWVVRYGSVSVDPRSLPGLHTGG